MTEAHIKEELDSDPFKPLRFHLVSGKTVDIFRSDGAITLQDRLLVFSKMSRDGRGAEGYQIIGYHNIESIEQLSIGRRFNGKRKPAQ